MKQFADGTGRGPTLLRRARSKLGAQLLGPLDAEIGKRIDVYATALFSGLSIDAIDDLDLSYSPPFGTPWDAAQSGAQDWERSVRVTSAA